MRTTLPASALASARRPFDALLRTRLASALSTPHGVDHYLALVNRAWSTHEIRARVVGVRRETRDALSLLLAPNARWTGFTAGQYLHLSVQVGGIRHTRTFSISSAPRDGTPLRITLRDFPDGRVSGWAARQARRGDLVELSPAQGAFVIGEHAPARLLFISAGSGITPIMSMVRQLLLSGHPGVITCLHYARHEIIFHDELAALAREFPNFRFVPKLTAHPGAASRFCLEELERADSGWQQSETFVCGPAELERSVRRLWEEHGAGARLHVERFRPLSLTANDESASRKHRLVFGKSGTAIEGHGAASLLEQAESAGLRPAFGCRMGICHTCKCQKRSGIVRNLLTGRISGPSDESIQLCISVPLSDVELDL